MSHVRIAVAITDRYVSDCLKIKMGSVGIHFLIDTGRLVFPATTTDASELEKIHNTKKYQTDVSNQPPEFIMQFVQTASTSGADTTFANS